MNLSDLFKKKSAAERVADRESAKTEEAKPKAPMIDFARLMQDFQTLNPQDPGLWPLAPRIVILLVLFLLLIAAAWWFGWNVQLEDLEVKRQQEEKAKEEWLSKKTKAVNLDEYRRQLVEIDRAFGDLLKQLPNKAEMGDMLVDINKAAQSRGLQVDLFKPGNEAAREFYAEVPITLNLVGSYHDIGAFAGDIAKLPRIVTLNEIKLTSGGASGNLTLNTTAKTFRYLDDAEVASQKKGAKK
jgi:type IV pilus assembly protein PilO